METKTKSLRNGIILKDSRSLGCGISIENKNTKYMTLCYSSEYGFYLNTKGVWITDSEWFKFNNEMNNMRLAMIEANAYLLGLA